ncbi:MAG: aldo/keto reductase [Anaerolineae bacterium]|nr:aldo/keto reductase [Anaerolineae bacterium]
MEYRALGKTGLQVSKLGFGASPFGSAVDEHSEREAIQAVHMAIDLGVNFIDVSPYYGVTRAETVLGKALQNIPRESYYLSTKVGRYGAAAFDFSEQCVAVSIDESLKRLHVDYVDVILCHDVEFGSLDQIINETIPALRRIQEAGKARFIGISGLPLKIFRAVTEQTDLDLILSYCHYCLNDTALAGLVPYFNQKQIGIINASPFSMGLLTESGPPVWHPASDELKTCCAAAARYCRNQGVSIAQLALQYSLAQSDFATTLVGIANSEQITTNVGWMHEPLDPELLREVQSILEPIRNQSWPSGKPENNDTAGV